MTKWAEVAAALEAEIAAGALAEGARLPTEPALMARYGVGRATLRQAVASLQQRGVLRAEQGRGTFVGARRLTYAISRRTSFSRNLAAQGFEPGGELISEHPVAAEAEVAAMLGIAPGRPVIHRHGIGMADGVPVELADVYVPLDRFPDWQEVRARHSTYGATFAALGVAVVQRLHTRIAARMPTQAEAGLLRQAAAAPVFVLTRVDGDEDGRPVLFGRGLWSAERVEFDLTEPDAADARDS